ncbi:YceK/YidQ family lipoprotein [Vibrio rotiferianus]|uniref:YceK/YidQ family lipoprotein n=1 Tax=Vibrio rotiferianus TaxID=190895 RepID=UPI003909E9FB
MKKQLALMAALTMQGCATVETINPPNNHVRISHEGKRSYCQDIPKIYSGVNYNMCLLNGEPSYSENTGPKIDGVPFFVFDTVFSAIADTLVLPYTITMQAEKGSIDVN